MQSWSPEENLEKRNSSAALSNLPFGPQRTPIYLRWDYNEWNCYERPVRDFWWHQWIFTHACKHYNHPLDQDLEHFQLSESSFMRPLCQQLSPNRNHYSGLCYHRRVLPVSNFIEIESHVMHRFRRLHSFGMSVILSRSAVLFPQRCGTSLRGYTASDSAIDRRWTLYGLGLSWMKLLWTACTWLLVTSPWTSTGFISIGEIAGQSSA